MSREKEGIRGQGIGHSGLGTHPITPCPFPGLCKPSCLLWISWREGEGRWLGEGGRMKSVGGGSVKSQIST